MGQFEEQFKDKEYCMQQILEARALFGNKNTTENQYNAMQKVLGFILFYGPKEIISIVQATIYEASLRRLFFISHIWNKEK